MFLWFQGPSKEEDKKIFYQFDFWSDLILSTLPGTFMFQFSSQRNLIIQFQPNSIKNVGTSQMFILLKNVNSCTRRQARWGEKIHLRNMSTN